MCSAVSRRGLPRGAASRAFPAAAAAAAASKPDRPGCVLVDVDAEGYLCAAGAGAAAGVEGAAVRARLAPHVQACNAVLSRVGADAAPCAAAGDTRGAAPHAAAEETRGATPHAGTGTLRLQLVRPVAPLHELLLWFDEELLAAIDMPFLTLKNIRGRRDYECHECGARFEEPNPLKTHLFLRCAPHAPQRFWRRVAAALAAGAAPPRLPSPSAPASAFRRVASGAPPHSLAAATGDAAARLEALATEWGRRGGGGGGHVCVYCGKLYSRKYGLKIHLRTHTGYRPLRCRHCSRAFGDPSNLNKHVRLHAAPAAAPGAAPRRCPRCGRALARRRDVERHLQHCAAPAASMP